MPDESGEGAGHRTPASRDDVLRALQRHGISRTVGAALWTAARDLTRRTRRRGTEHAVTLDMANGQAVAPMLTGSATATNLSPHIRTFEPDHKYVVMHTHPRSTSFSNRDIRVLAEQAAIPVMVVVDADGTWYVVSQRGPSTVTCGLTVESDYLIELDRLRQVQVPVSERPHLAMEHIAARGQCGG